MINSPPLKARNFCGGEPPAVRISHQKLPLPLIIGTKSAFQEGLSLGLRGAQTCDAQRIEICVQLYASPMTSFAK